MSLLEMLVATDEEFAGVLQVELPKRKQNLQRFRSSLPRPAKCALQPDDDHGDPLPYVNLG
jgi:hypothetical protein